VPAPARTQRIWSKARFTWIQAQAGPGRGWIGYLGLGGSAPLKGGSIEAARVPGGSGGCDAWYAIEPRGFVCAGAAATVDENDSAIVQLRRDAADLSSPWPHQYGESIWAPRYARIPTAAEQRDTEWYLDKHKENIARALETKDPATIEAIDKDLVGVDLSPAGEGPPSLLPFGPLVREERKFVALGSTVAWVRSFDVDGRTFLLTADQAIVPKDRVRPYPRSTFHGLAIGEDVTLPLAFFRKTPRPKWKRGEDGKLAQTGEAWPRLGWVGLTGVKVEEDGKKFYETKEPGIFVRNVDAQVVEAETEAPFLTGPDKDKLKWIDVRVLNGTLVAYEGLRPVYATLISPGRGGIPVDGVDPLKTASTPTGMFRVDGKFRTSTMVSSSDENYIHSDVNWILNFSGPHALHGAYWHDGWGEPKSGGCVNMAPIDAKWVFDWTDPDVPEGWHGLRAVKDFGVSTKVRIRR
jgi:hypothetical protein